MGKRILISIGLLLGIGGVYVFANRAKNFASTVAINIKSFRPNFKDILRGSFFADIDIEIDNYVQFKAVVQSLVIKINYWDGTGWVLMGNNPPQGEITILPTTRTTKRIRIDFNSISAAIAATKLVDVSTMTFKSKFQVHTTALVLGKPIVTITEFDLTGVKINDLV